MLLLFAAMDVFQSPLAFNYVSFGFLSTVQRFLTCIAIVTAAISFWRIRTVGSNSFHRTKSSGDSPSPSPEAEKEKPFHQQKACSSFDGVGAIESDENDCNNDGRVINGKFTLYYDDDLIPIDGDGDGDGVGVGVELVCSYREELYYSNGSWSSDGIWVGRDPRGGDFGWYSSQDLTVLNGSVVRLWDHHRRRCLRPSDCFLAL